MGDNDTKPVIISDDLTKEEEHKLLEVLHKHPSPFAWSILDIKGISPSVCMHKILMEDDYKPMVEHQRRLNPAMKEVVKKEVLKWLNVGFIYAISDSSWVRPVHVVPKMGGMKLNKATRKYDFPLPFINQMLDRLAGHHYYCFLDGHSCYNQIAIAPEDQEKATFTCPYAVRPLQFPRHFSVLHDDYLRRFG